MQAAGAPRCCAQEKRGEARSVRRSLAASINPPRSRGQRIDLAFVQRPPTKEVALRSVLFVFGRAVKFPCVCLRSQRRPLCLSQRYINGFECYADGSDRFAPAFWWWRVGGWIMASMSPSKHPGKSFSTPPNLHAQVGTARAVRCPSPHPPDRFIDSHDNGSLAADLMWSPRAPGSARLASSSGAEQEVMSS